MLKLLQFHVFLQLYNSFYKDLLRKVHVIFLKIDPEVFCGTSGEF